MLCLIFSFSKVYEPVEEGSYIKMIDMVSGHGGQIQVSVALFWFVSCVVFEDTQKVNISIEQILHFYIQGINFSVHFI